LKPRLCLVMFVLVALTGCVNTPDDSAHFPNAFNQALRFAAEWRVLHPDFRCFGGVVTRLIGVPPYRWIAVPTVAEPIIDAGEAGERFLSDRRTALTKEERTTVDWWRRAIDYRKGTDARVIRSIRYFDETTGEMMDSCGMTFYLLPYEDLGGRPFTIFIPGMTRVARLPLPEDRRTVSSFHDVVEVDIDERGGEGLNPSRQGEDGGGAGTGIR
jgi:hypothetical protein